MKKTAKFAVSMPEPEFRDVESLRRKSGKTRSQFVRDAIRAWKSSPVPSGSGQARSSRQDKASPSVQEEACRYGAQPCLDLTDETERRRRAIAAAGRFKSDVGDLSVKHDEHLEDAYLETVKKGTGEKR